MEDREMIILTIEEMSNNLGEIETIVTKCRSKIYLLQSQFKPLAFGHDLEVDDEVLWAMGINEVCEEIVKDLTETYDLMNNFCNSIELCSIDDAKVEKQKKYLKSIGIKDP